MRDKIIRSVMDALDRVYSKTKGATSSRRKWTTAVLSELCCASKDRAFKELLCCPDPVDLNSAWLYDMVWYRKNGKCLAEIPLVLELEWSTQIDDVRYDLEKLLVAKANVKVLIVDGQCDNIENVLRDEIDTFDSHRVEERYLLAKWNPNRFEYLLFDGVGGQMQIDRCDI